MPLPVLDIALESLQTRFPTRRHGRQPFARGGESLRVERIADVTARSLARDEPRFTEYVQVLRDRLTADRKALRELRRCGRPRREPAHQLAPRGIGERGEYVLLHVQPYGCTWSACRQTGRNVSARLEDHNAAQATKPPMTSVVFSYPSSCSRTAARLEE